ncbi:uncharacterized protein B0H64DRAFT_465853 [Chaetomium fimeti]|uniref:Uncharacterized protein n=1 Tax=Chaetomium fimeti TaxID=1854472 RepID=A0AAE0HBK6_9PEZI|nr:hypothetical protein B0H64DRAFT_465853 [Chaetomium fimeti]
MSKVAEPRPSNSSRRTLRFFPLRASSAKHVTLFVSHSPRIGRQAEPVGDRAIDIMQCNPRDGRWSGRRRSMPSDGSRDPSFATGTVLILWVSEAPDQERAPGSPRGSETRLHGGLNPVRQPMRKVFVHTNLVWASDSRWSGGRTFIIDVGPYGAAQDFSLDKRPRLLPGGDRSLFHVCSDAALSVGTLLVSLHLFETMDVADEPAADLDDSPLLQDTANSQRHGDDNAAEPTQDQAQEATPRPMIEMQDPRSARSVDPRWPPGGPAVFAPQMQISASPPSGIPSPPSFRTSEKKRLMRHSSLGPAATASKAQGAGDEMENRTVVSYGIGITVWYRTETRRRLRPLQLVPFPQISA